MIRPHSAIEHLSIPPADADVAGLATLLIDAVDSGAAVSFVAPLPADVAAAWWRKCLAGLPDRGVVLIARDAAGICGTVQVQPAWAPNQPHRAEIAKLLVHRRARGAGLGRALMEAAERAASDAGFTLLTLDAKKGGAAERLYRRLGWTCVGAIPGFAVDTDRTTLHDCVIFYKSIGPRS